MVAQGENSQAAAEHQGESPSSSTLNQRDGTTPDGTPSAQATEVSSPKSRTATTGVPNATGGGMAATQPPPPPPPTVHQPNMHYFHHSYRGVPPPPPPPVGYDPSRKIVTVGSSDTSTPSTGAPPPPLPGPYTTAQYETRKPAPPLPLPHYQGTAPTVAPQHAGRQPPIAKANSSPPSATSSGTVGRDPPPPSAHPPTQHFHHPSMHGDHAPTTTLHHHAYPYPEERIHGPPPHRAWSGRDFSSSAAHRHYYDSSAGSNSASHGYPSAAGSYPSNRPPPPASGTTTQATTLHSGMSQSTPVGPYRFSDPTLRREALTSLKTSSTPNSDLTSEVGGREGATSPSQIESSHREEVTTMGCTCKKTKCLKLYCQCFAVKIYCGGNCRCMSCHNTADFENERQEAIRMILSRNPQAFDTKFKKSLPDKSRPELSHKLGCKCRKSACMKKYCECYAGNVKCSSNCRCVGCKNMPTGGIPPPPPAPGAPHLSLAGTFPLSNHKKLSSTSNHGMGMLGANAMILLGGDQAGTPVRKQREPYMMNAAQNLTFLKHASPAANKSASAPRRTSSQDTGDMASMPSLASEESPAEQSREESLSVPRVAKVIPEPTSAEKTAVNALLMAAVAMTEMSTNTVTSSAVEPNSVSTPPRPSVSTPTDSKKDIKTPTRSNEDNYRTPQKNLMRQFQSPKRKQVDIRDGDAFSTVRVPPEKTGDSSTEASPSSVAGADMEVSPKREHSAGANFTPGVQQKIKRSRVGSLRKGPPRDLTSDLHQSNTMVLETPKQSKEVKTELTPVSARCIDFKRMHVHESTTPESKSTNTLTST